MSVGEIVEKVKERRVVETSIWGGFWRDPRTGREYTVAYEIVRYYDDGSKLIKYTPYHPFYDYLP